jgi:hypothetical protein
MLEYYSSTLRSSGEAHQSVVMVEIAAAGPEQRWKEERVGLKKKKPSNILC